MCACQGLPGPRDNRVMFHCRSALQQRAEAVLHPEISTRLRCTRPSPGMTQDGDVLSLALARALRDAGLRWTPSWTATPIHEQGAIADGRRSTAGAATTPARAVRSQP
jgi:hypothetical protein